MCDSLETIVREEEPVEDNPQDYANLVADLPDYQPQVCPIKEYENSPREKVWSPVAEVNELWIPRFISIAQSVLTEAQESNGVPAIDALENSCNDYGLELILKVLHESGCAPEVALDSLIFGELPKKLTDRWTIDEVMDIVEFYYTWKRSGRAAKGLVASRARRFFKKRQNSFNLVIESPHAVGAITRSRTSPKNAFLKGEAKPSLSATEKHVFKGVKRKRRARREYLIEP